MVKSPLAKHVRKRLPAMCRSEDHEVACGGRSARRRIVRTRRAGVLLLRLHLYERLWAQLLTVSPLRPQVVETAQNSTSRLTPLAPVPFGSVPPSTPVQASLTVNPAKTYQKMLGFGGAFTDSASIILSALNKDLVSSLAHMIAAAAPRYPIPRRCRGALRIVIASSGGMLVVLARWRGVADANARPPSWPRGCTVSSTTKSWTLTSGPTVSSTRSVACPSARVTSPSRRSGATTTAPATVRSRR